MKKFKHALLILSAIVIVVSACKKDNAEEKQNSFSYNGSNHELSKGIIESYGSFPDETAFNFDVILMSTGFTLYESNGEPDSISGIGNAIVMEFYSSDSTDLAAGEYTYDVTRAEGTFDYADAVMNFNTVTEEGTEIEISGGTIVVNKNGSNYEFSFKLESYEKSTLSGYYLGPLHRYNFDPALKSRKY